jgi:hypothetical protein
MSSEFSGSFYIGISAIASTAFLALLAHCFRLKYSKVDCGIFSCTRDIALENESYELELEHEHPITPPRITDVIPSPTIQNSRRNSQN